MIAEVPLVEVVLKNRRNGLAVVQCAHRMRKRMSWSDSMVMWYHSSSMISRTLKLREKYRAEDQLQRREQTREGDEKDTRKREPH